MLLIRRYKNGKEVSADARLKIFRDSKRSESYWMSLTVMKEQDAGEYEVRATNILGSVESKSIVTVISEYKSKHRVLTFTLRVYDLFVLVYLIFVDE